MRTTSLQTPALRTPAMTTSTITAPTMTTPDKPGNTPWNPLLPAGERGGDMLRFSGRYTRRPEKLWKDLDGAWFYRYNQNRPDRHARKKLEKMKADIRDINALKHPETGEPAPVWTIKSDRQGVRKLQEIYRMYPARPDQQDTDGNTLLGVLLQYGNGNGDYLEKVVQTVVSAGADYSETNRDGDCLIVNVIRNQRMSQSQQKDWILKLIRAGVAVDTPGKDGATPLMVAVAEGETNLVEFLVNKVGADPRLTDNKNRDIWYYLGRNTHSESYEAIDGMLQTMLGKSATSEGVQSVMDRLSGFTPERRRSVIQRLKEEIELRKEEQELADLLREADLSQEDYESLGGIMDNFEGGQE